jgi:hypothetical protein
MRATNTERAAEHRRELRELRDLLSESQSCVIALREQLQANAGVWPSREELIRELAEYRERVGAMEREGTSLPPSRAPSPPTAPPPDIDAAELVPLRTEIGELQRVKNRQSSVIDMLRQEVHDLREGRTSKQVAWQNRRSMKVGENPGFFFHPCSATGERCGLHGPHCPAGRVRRRSPRENNSLCTHTPPTAGV